ncbi:hypothetical protein SASPL_134937 [Salvia splendens]|uniref:Phytochrome-interacting factor 4 n=1 Tax=Salvia splendens TaxID=180675 RepID=A0A8X8WWY0_SALSN|nr:hypothetical protein SASPL_134937 [Salvia splendens]
MNSFATDPLSLDYELADLTWENGPLAAYGLGASWEKPPLRPADTLESIVDQGTCGKLVPWLDHSGGGKNASAFVASMDALVPCHNGGSDGPENCAEVPGNGACTVGSCSGVGRGSCTCYTSASPSDTCGGGGSDSAPLTMDSCERDFGLTSTSLWSPENTSSGEDYTRTSGDENDTVYCSRSQGQAGKKENRKLGIRKSSISAKVRAAAIHNQSERTDKASMLDEVIDYMKQLQAQVNMISRMTMPSMMMPLSMLQMSMMTPSMGMAMPMPMPMHRMGVIDIGRAIGMPPMMPSAAAFMSMPPWDIQPPAPTPDFLSNYFATQSQVRI